MASARPVVVGAAQVTNRSRDVRDARSPLDLMTEAATRALADCDVANLASHVDSVRVVNVLSWPSPDPPGDLATAIGTRAGERVYSGIGGHTPQWLVNETADQLARGEVKLALLTGAEAMHSLRLVRSCDEQPGWGPRGRPVPNAGDPRPGFGDEQMRHGAHMPAHAYPLFENAFRAHHGWSISEHRRRLGRIGEALSSVAASNTYAWFPEARTADEITDVSPTNRMVAFPYTKYLNAIIEVDQSAALVLTTESHARDLGIPDHRFVYLHGCADLNDSWNMVERGNFYSAPALRVAGQRALAMAGATIDEIEMIDIYSCFPSAVQIGREALDIGEDDPRPLTVTGGLPYFGGPGNNYQTHAIATLVSRLRLRPDALGITTGLGWFETKHSVGIYGARRPSADWRRPDLTRDQAEIDAVHRVRTLQEFDGPAAVEAYTVLYGRDGAPERTIIVGRTAAGERFLANGPVDDVHVAALVEHEGVGLEGRVGNDPAMRVNRFEW